MGAMMTHSPSGLHPSLQIGRNRRYVSRRMSMKRRLPLLVIVAVALAAYAGYRMRQARAPYEWSGTVEAHTIEVGSRVGGRIEQVVVREGDPVAAGQPRSTLEKGRQ